MLFSLATVSAAVACAALVALSSALFRHPPLSLLCAGAIVAAQTVRVALCFRLASRQFLKRRKA